MNGKLKRHAWSKLYRIIPLMFAVLFLGAVLINTNSEEKQVDAQAAPSSYFGTIPLTGVMSPGGARDNQTGSNSHDKHWDIQRIYNQTGRQTCQGNNGNRLAVKVEESGGRAGLGYDGSRPWSFTSGNSRWIGQNAAGRSEGHGLHNPHPAGGSWCYDPGYQGPPANSTQVGPPGSGSMPTDPGFDRWNTYVFQLRSAYYPTIDSRVDLSTVRLEMRGAADDFIGVAVNDVPLPIASCSGGVDTFRTESGGNIQMCQTGLSGFSNFTVRNTGSAFRHGTNKIEVYVKSAFTNTGFILTEAKLTGSVTPVPDPTNWNYTVGLSTSPSSSTSSPYRLRAPGTNMSLSSSVRNNNDGRGRNYSHRFQVRVGGGSWSNIRSTSGHGALNPSASRNHSASYTLPTNVSNGTNICFRAGVSPYSGQSTPSSTVTSSGWRNSTVRCITINQTCDSLPNPHVEVTLRRIYSQSSPSGYAPYGSSRTERDTTETRYRSRSDISSGGGRVLPGIVSQRAGNPGEVVLDYQDYIDAYPYDYNQARVSYYHEYRERRWTATGSPVYEDIYEWQYRDHDGDGDREWRYVDTGRNRLVGYRWELQSTRYRTDTRSVNARRMDPCWNRTYRATANIVGNPSLNPDRESPSNSRMAGEITVQFGVEYPAQGRSTMRQRSRVRNLPYAVNNNIGGTSNFTRTITATSYAKNATGSHSFTRTENAADRPPLNVGDTVCWTIYATRVNSAGSQRQGDIDISGNISNASGHQFDSECTPPVVNWPYFKVFGNDVISGGDFGSCSPVNDGDGIRTFFRSGANTGSSTQYAAFAMNAIEGFTSASLRTSDPRPPTGLTFANQGAGTFGGSYAGNDGTACVPDYFGTQPADTIAMSSSGSDSARGNRVIQGIKDTNTDPEEVEYYSINGDVNMHNMSVGGGGGRVPNGSRKVFYIDGTLTISDDIEFNTTWSDRNDVPFVMFVARDIVINSNVTQIDGVYVAQPGGGGTGSISTCQTRSFNTCQNRLVINGALVADSVNLYRTRGSLRDSRLGEGRSGVNITTCSHNSPSNHGTRGGNTCAAEIINFTPEVYLVLSQILTPGYEFKYDSYVTLPPNL